jgi:purine-cytosine permease-like protein
MGQRGREAGGAFELERHGTDFIPLHERWASARDLAAMWAGASTNVEYLVYGAILATFGFSFSQCVALIVIGNLSYLLVGLSSLQGPKTGTTVFTINKAAFGVHGSRPLAAMNWLTQLGFETEGMILIVGAAIALLTMAGFHLSQPAKFAVIVISVGAQVVLPYFGHATMVKVLRIMALPFIVGYLVFAVFASQHSHLAHAQVGAGWQLWLIGLAFTITLSGLGWTENGNDYSRYLPPETSPKKIVGWVFLATALPQTLIMIIGVAVATFLGGAAEWNGANPFTAFTGAQQVLPHWFSASFLLLCIFQLLCINSLDLYSSSVSLQALGLKITRGRAVLLDSGLVLMLTSYAIFSSSFSVLLKDFVILVICWISPWVAIFLTDWLLRRRHYEPAALQSKDRSGIYWGGPGGIHWPAFGAQIIGSALALMAVNNPALLVGPLASWSGTDLSIPLSLVAASASYLGLVALEARMRSRN